MTPLSLLFIGTAQVHVLVLYIYKYIFIIIIIIHLYMDKLFTFKLFWLKSCPVFVDISVALPTKPSHIRFSRCPHKRLHLEKQVDSMDTENKIHYTSTTPTTQGNISHARQ